MRFVWHDVCSLLLPRQFFGVVNMKRVLSIAVCCTIALLSGCSNAPEPQQPVPAINRFTVSGDLYPETTVDVSREPVPLTINPSLGIQQVSLRGLINEVDTMLLTLSWDGTDLGSYPWSGSKNSARYIRMVIRTADGKRIDMQPEPSSPIGETIIEGTDDTHVYGRFYGHLRGGGASLTITHGYFRSVR